MRGSPRVGERVHLPEAVRRVDRRAGRGTLAAAARRSETTCSRGSSGSARCRCRRTSVGPAGRRRTTGRATRPRLPACRARSRRRRPACTSRPGCSTAARAAGVEHVTLTLHVGPGTFLPIRGGDLAGYRMAPERYELPRGDGGPHSHGPCRRRARRSPSARPPSARSSRRPPTAGSRGGTGDGRAVHPAGTPLPGGRRPAHELPSAADAAAGAGRRVRRLGAGA